MLDERIKTYESLKDDHETLRACKYKTERSYKQRYAFLKKVGAFALQQARFIPVRRRELTSVDMRALALGDESETSVGIPVRERSRNLVEQAEQSVQATRPWL
jgi:AMMECR1 domain-containing protein